MKGWLALESKSRLVDVEFIQHCVCRVVGQLAVDEIDLSADIIRAHLASCVARCVVDLIVSQSFHRFVSLFAFAFVTSTESILYRYRNRINTLCNLFRKNSESISKGPKTLGKTWLN